jgi:signal transduction histidine kinase
VVNALAHTPAGGFVSIVVGREPTAAADSHITLSVADTGSGIPPDQLPKVFDRFFKGAGSRGTGLGLAIARDLVAAHGGVMNAASTAWTAAVGAVPRAREAALNQEHAARPVSITPSQPRESAHGRIRR